MPSEDDSSNSRIHEVKISSDRRQLVIKLVPLCNLKPHEDHIEDLYLSLRSKMQLDKLVKDPIISDYKRGLVIDGTHRILALKDLNIDYIPTIDIDYLDSSLKVYRWFRIYHRNAYERILKKYIKQLTKITYDALNEYSLYIIYNYKLGVILDHTHIGRLMDIMRSIERELREYGYNPTFKSDREVIEAVLHGKFNFEKYIILGYRVLKKREIINAYKSGIRLNYKTTRHIPPYRIINIDIPINYLYQENIPKAISYLNNLKIRYIGRMIVINGRLYEEDVYEAVQEY